MKKWILSLAGALWMATAVAGAPEGINSLEWTLYTTENGVEIYMKKQACDDPANGVYLEYVLIKVVNTNNQDAEVSWVPHPFHDNMPAFDSNSDDERSASFTLSAGSALEGTCGDQRLSEYKRFTDKDDMRELTDLELANLTVTLK
ncbi:hypothetical protein HZ996_02110 [Cryomorphaceae bacterium]|nr:hypothetical protein HZ996_02110 [Cryomorphaceae bacterium]